VSPLRLRALSLALYACAYTYVFPYQAKLNNPNENVRLYMTAALVEDGSYSIDGPRAHWGWVNDAAVRGGHAYSVKAPGTSLLGVPGYFAYRTFCRATGHAFDRSEVLWVCRFVASILPSLAGAWWFFGFLLRRGYSARLVAATSLAVWLGSLLYGYGMLFVSHTSSAVVAFVAFGWLFEVSRGERVARPLTAAAAGLLAAATTWFEYPGLVVSLVLAGYALVVLRSWQLRGAWFAGTLPLAALMMHFQWRAFGNPFTPGHLFVESAAFRAAHEQGLYGAVGPSWSALQGLLFDLGAGLFPLTPLLVFALPGLVIMIRQRQLRAAGVTCTTMFVLSTLAIASMNNWRGGWTIGPRYLAMVVPFLGFAATHALAELGRRAPLWAAGVALGTAIAGCIASGLPGAYYPHLPPEFTRPLPQLFAVLIAHDFAPPNLGNLVGAWGSMSMLPVAACAVAAVALALCAEDEPTARRLRVLGVACLSAGLCLWPLYVRPQAEPGMREAVAFVTRRWSPDGHDHASRLHQQLKGKSGDPARWQQLRALYTAEGRDAEGIDAFMKR
jgi:hypothetical protein